MSEAMDHTCLASVDATICDADGTCKTYMEAAKQCGKAGGNMVACLTMNAAKLSKKVMSAWTGLLKCYAKESTKRVKDLFSAFSFPKAPWSAKKRRLAAGVTAAVRITTGGNNGLIGTPSSSLSASAAAAKSTTVSTSTATAGTASMGAGMTALIALVSVGAVVGAAVGIKKRNSQTGFAAGNAGAPAPGSLEVSTRGAAKEDATDIL